ncbi:MAG TPA: lamin tail domain-containing protein [Candidatus Limnocylindrales bacterium]|nr:lamin tail domain-containing protein [Candidatus Limnocylindrales bacterium]
MSGARVERWILILIALSLVLVHAGALSGPTVKPPTESPPAPHLWPLAAGTVSWPPSGGLVVAEVVTRGGAASDQYVELYNASTVPLGLAGLELVYVTASGATVTRKQAWSELSLPPRHHLLIANAAGAYAPIADGLFSGGFSTTGGTVVLRSTAGPVIDSLSWGAAANSFVEGSPGSAPPTGSSLERRPGGLLGNAIDSNDNGADALVQPQPIARNLSAGALPLAVPTPTLATSAPLPSLAPLPTGSTPTQAPLPTEELPPPFEDDPPGDDPDELADPTAPLEGTPTFDPGPIPGSPGPTALAGGPSAVPATVPPATAPPTTPPPATSFPEPSAPPPTPSTTPHEGQPSIAELRNLPLGTVVTAHGWLSTPLGLTESGRGGFVEDPTGGIALYLASGPWSHAPAVGTSVKVSGVLETRFSLLTIRLAAPEQLEAGPLLPPSPPLRAFVNEVGEGLEGRLVTVEGVVSDGISSLVDGFSTAIDDGTGTLRVVVATATGIDRGEMVRGRHLRLTGVVGQRDSSGTGLGGYRLHLRSSEDVHPLPMPTPTPTPTAGPSAAPTLVPSPAASAPAASPSPAPTSPAAGSPTPSPAVAPIALARQMPVGQRVTVQGVVTVRPGRVLGDRTICLQDSSGGICVRLPEGLTAAAGEVLVVDGVLADPYGNLELRPAANGVTKVGSAAMPPARQLTTAELGEQTEGLLALVRGTVTSSSASSTGAVTVMLEDATGEGRIYIHAPLGMSRDQFPRGRRLAVYGIVGDRLGLYRLWPRDPGDFVTESAPGTPSTPPPTAPTPPVGPISAPPAPPAGGLGPGSSPAPEKVTIGEALRRVGQKVTVEGVVTAPAGLLDADGRRVTMQDGSGALLLRLPTGAQPPAVGQRVRAAGEVGTYYGAPQLAASEMPQLLGAAGVEALRIARAPLPGSAEWRLVVVTGHVESVSRNGDAWRAELAVDGGTIPVVGLARSAISVDVLVKGRSATVTGLVRRAYPTATDQRLAVVPRSRGDISQGSLSDSTPGPGGSEQPGEPLPSSVAGWPAGAPDVTPGPAGASPQPGDAQAIFLAELAAHEGRYVQVGGRVERFIGERVMISDGTGVAALLLAAEARALLMQLRPGLLVNARGLVVRLNEGGLAVRIDSAADLLTGAGSFPPRTPYPSGRPSPSPAASYVEAPRAAASVGDEGTAMLIALLAVMGAVTGSATAFFASQPRYRRAVRETTARLRKSAYRWRGRLGRTGPP